ncbi:MAG: alanine racemase [candidate division KSB1 bacterium]|nr:alanine racemase [candidate division KSB1 bacterium]MDZ7367417.1 alanine racemase [candidate division KSB1 bacterium]MDZ7405478.1 alanine racemase [candidate division KSB1 bacterium]
MISLRQLGSPLRPAWVEVNLTRLRQNSRIIRADMPPALKWCAVVKDQAYGHGAVEIARETIQAGAACLAVATLDEALELQEAQLGAPILIFGERPQSELEWCIEKDFAIFVNDPAQAKQADEIARDKKKRIHVHVEIDTGLSRYGVRWTKALSVIESILPLANLQLVGLMTHFAMSDELDKTFAYEQLRRFEEVIQQLRERKILPAKSILLHACNSGGYLDLPPAHFDMVRMGILPLGVYPSKVCRRLAGLAPVMSVKTRIATMKEIAPGDTVGYGMRYRAESPRRIAVLPIGYGDGFPRVRNTGYVLVRGKRAPIIGGNAMDAMMIDITDIPETNLWDEVAIVGKQGDDEISVHDLAAWGQTVSYDIMTRWSVRMPRVYIE